MDRALTTEQELTVAAARLARSNPVYWEQFMAALAGFSDTTTSNCIMSPLDELPRAQGRAQAIARLSQSLRNAVANADKLEGRKT